MEIDETRYVVRSYLGETADTVLRVQTECLDDVIAAAEALTESLRAGGTILICGNGGSAADAQHFATEFVSTLTVENRRPSIPAIALTTDTSLLTAICNDYGFEGVFERQIEAIGRAGDVLVAISTSGNSENVLRAAGRSRERGMAVIALTGASGGKLAAAADVAIRVPSEIAAHIQESHLAVEHLLAKLVEDSLYPRGEEAGGKQMGKSKDKGSNKAEKKKPQKSVKEKRAAKRAKRGSSSGSNE